MAPSVVSTPLRVKSARFQFNVPVGTGVHYLFRDDTALTMQSRWLHFSEAGITKPNHGTNSQIDGLTLAALGLGTAVSASAFRARHCVARRGCG